MSNGNEDLALPRLLVIGNSHSAAPRMAHATDPSRWPDYRVEFLAVRGGNIANLQLRGTVLFPTDAKTAEQMQAFNFVQQLDLSGFDAFAVVGGFGWANFAELFDGHRCVDFPSVIMGDAEGQLVGHSLLELVLQIRVRRNFAARLMSQLKPLRKPVVMMPEPLPSVDCSRDPKGYGAYLAMARRGDAGHCRRLFQRVATAALEDLAILPFWPETAIVDDAFTSPDLMRGAPRLSPGFDVLHPPTDFAHGNTQYGALVMDRIIQALRTAERAGV